MLFVHRNVHAERGRGGLGAVDEVHPAPSLASRVVFLDNRLVVLEGVHLDEIVVADDLGDAR